MKKALVLASVASMIDQFNMDNIKILQDLGYEVDVACNFEHGSTTSRERVINFRQELSEIGVTSYQISVPRQVKYFKDIILAYKQVKRLISCENYKIVHCQSPIGGVIARLACINARKQGTKVIYTAHGFHFYNGAPIKNWLVYYPIEKWLARYTDVLITINKEDYNRAKKSFKAGRIEYIPGVGLDTEKFRMVSISKTAKRKELSIPNDSFLMLSVGELNKNKNHEVIIKALAKLKKPNVYYIICGQGPLKDYLSNLARKLSIERQVKLLGFRSDISEIFIAADLFVFPSYREGLSVSLMEAMATGLPIICSKIRGNTDLIVDGKGGYLINPKDVEGFTESINKVIDLHNSNMGYYNKHVVKSFSLENVLKMMRHIYEEVIYS